jgi:CRP-like cAMP-binding protein
MGDILNLKLRNESVIVLTSAKLANLLPILARKFGDEEEGRLVIRLRLTQEELAKMISTTRESVACALADLRRRGVLAVVGGRIVILDPDGLATTGGALGGVRHAR